MARATRKTPGCILFLLDCSGSMSGSKSQELAKCVNDTIQEFLSVCTNGSEVLDRFYIGAIRYGADVEKAIALGGDEILLPLSTLEQLPFVDGTEDRQWVTPQAAGGTPMEEAFKRACDVIEKWVTEHPNSPRPTIINVTDGQVFDDQNVIQNNAAQLRNLKTADGEVIVFNIHISDEKGDPVVLPTETQFLGKDFGGEKKFASMLFNMSSEITNEMIVLAETIFSDSPPKPGARGFAFNAPLTWLPRLFQIGTLPG